MIINTKYYLLRKLNQFRCRLISRKQNIKTGSLDYGYLTIFHDYEGKYALPQVTTACEIGVNYILDVEKEYNIKATYNIVGKLINDYPEIVQRIIDDGHELASHSFDHKIMADLSKDEVFSDITKSKEIFTVHELKLNGFRSPQSKWTFKQMHAYLDSGLEWTAENDSAKYPYVLLQKNNHKLIRLPIAMDDWEYIQNCIHPDKMFTKLKKLADEIASNKEYGAIGFHPWIQGEDKNRLLVYKQFIKTISNRKDLKIVTFGEMHDLFVSNIKQLKRKQSRGNLRWNLI